MNLTAVLFLTSHYVRFLVLAVAEGDGGEHEDQTEADVQPKKDAEYTPAFPDGSGEQENRQLAS